MGLFDILGMLVFGLVVGAIARFLVPGRQPMGLLMTMVLGIVGSFAGGFLSSLFFRGDGDHLHPAGWIMSIVGAVLLVLIYTKATAGRSNV